MKNTQWTLKARLWFMSLLLMGSTLIVGIVSLRNANELSEDLENIVQVELPALRNMTLLDMMHDGLRAVVLNAIVHSGSKDQKEIDAIREELADFTKQIKEYSATINKLDTGDDIKALLKDADPKITEYVEAAEKLVNVALSGKVEAAIGMLPAFQEKFEYLEGALEKLGEAIEKDAEKQSLEAIADKEKIQWISIALLAASLLAGGIISQVSIRDLINKMTVTIVKLSHGAVSLNNSADNLKQASGSLSDSTAKQASAVQETASSMEEINAMVNRTTESSATLVQSVQKSHSSADLGQSSVAEMLRAMSTIDTSNKSIMKQVDDSNQQISEIVRVISEIGNKTKVINDIVFQTKLLSFNASVEAARAGEHGKGFAVVAEEVGNLAQMSGNAAKEISSMLATGIERANTIVNETKAKVERLMQEGAKNVEMGTQVANKCGDALKQIVEQIEEVNRLTSEITSAIQEQSIGNQEIGKAIHLFNESTQKNSSVTQQASQISKELWNQATGLKTLVGEIESLLGVKSEGHLAPPASTTHTQEPEAIRPAGVVVQLPKRQKQEEEPVRMKAAVGATEIAAVQDDDSSFKDI